MAAGPSVPGRPKGWLLRESARWLGNLICFAAMALALYTVVSARLSPDGNPNLFGLRLLVVLSGSMEPTIHVGDMVAVSLAADARQLMVGEVITFMDEERQQYVTHRIIERRETGTQVAFRTQGDANNVADEQWVEPGQILGKLRFSVPYAGHLTHFVRSRTGLLTLVVAPGLLLIGVEMYRLGRVQRAVQADQTSTPMNGSDKKER